MPTLNLTKKNRVKAGEFIFPITIERLQNEGLPDSSGIVKPQWIELFSTRAKVDNMQGKEWMEDGVSERNRIVKNFYIRTNRSKKIKANDRILYDGEYYNVISAFDFDDKGIMTKIVTNKIE